MRKVRSIISIFLMAAILLCGAAAVSAEETQTDWANFDWENYKNADLSDQEWGSACKWFRAEADLELLFDMAMKVDGYRAEGMSGVLGERFKKDPVGLIKALSLEEDTVQTLVIQSIVFDAYPAEFEQLLNSLTLPEDAGPAAMNILVQMVQCAEETWGLDITNPHTGDPMGIAALLMVSSGLGGAVLLKRRKALL